MGKGSLETEEKRIGNPIRVKRNNVQRGGNRKFRKDM
jgi:hypothetical protein